MEGTSRQGKARKRGEKPVKEREVRTTKKSERGGEGEEKEQGCEAVRKRERGRNEEGNRQQEGKERTRTMMGKKR